MGQRVSGSLTSLTPRFITSAPMHQRPGSTDARPQSTVEYRGCILPEKPRVLDAGNTTQSHSSPSPSLSARARLCRRDREGGGEAVSGAHRTEAGVRAALERSAGLGVRSEGLPWRLRPWAFGSEVATADSMPTETTRSVRRLAALRVRALGGRAAGSLSSDARRAGGERRGRDGLGLRRAVASFGDELPASSAASVAARLRHGASRWEWSERPKRTQQACSRSSGK